MTHNGTFQSVYLDAARLSMHINREYDAALQPHNIGALEAHMLVYLQLNGATHASTLAATVSRAATSFTPVLDRLQERGLIMRRPDKHDRRAVFIELTETGKALAPELEAALVKAHALAVAAFSDATSGYPHTFMRNYAPGSPLVVRPYARNGGAQE